MKWSKPRNTRKAQERTPTQVALQELASAMRRMRLHGQPTSQAMEVEYRQLLAKHTEERART